MAKDERIDRRDRESAVNSAVGGLLSWVAGQDSVKRGIAPADGAMGELLPWVTGKVARRTSACGDARRAVPMWRLLLRARRTPPHRRGPCAWPALGLGTCHQGSAEHPGPGFDIMVSEHD